MVDARALIYALMVGTNRNTAYLMRPGLGGQPNSTYSGGVGTGISIKADDGTTVLSPNIVVPTIGGTGSTNINDLDAVLLDVEMHPYAQEGMGKPKPQVIVGPMRPGRRTPLTIGKPWYEIDDVVEVRIVCRNWDSNELGFTLDGAKARANLVTAIAQVMATNYANPDGAGNWQWIRLQNNGSDDDKTPDPQTGVNVYKTTLNVIARRYSLTD